MLVLVQVSSMKTRRAGSIPPCRLCHCARRRATSGRSRSSAIRVFFYASYQRAQGLTHAGDSLEPIVVIHHGKRARFSMAAAIELRNDLSGDDLRRLARDSQDAKQVRRLLALAVIRDGGT